MSIQVAQDLRATRLLASWALALCLFLSSVSQAHVRLNSPNGGEMLSGGDEFTIEWQVQAEHTLIDWDLEYSIISSDGPWLEIATNLAGGDPAKNSIHTFDWSIPNQDIPSAWVRVRQDNEMEDYYGTSENSFSISAILGGADFTGDGSVDAADLAAWQLGFGTSGASPANGDADLDGDVDGADFLAWQIENADTIASEALTAESVPEPTTPVLLLLGTIFMVWQRH